MGSDKGRKLPLLYLITDRKACRGDFFEAVQSSLKGAIRLVQLREKDLCAREALAMAKKLRELTSRYNALLLINDRADIALLSGADGVHLTSSGYSPVQARSMLGNNAVVGVSTHSIEEAKRAAAQDADFVTFGPVFHTPSKAGYGEPLGVEMLAKTVKEVSIPVYGLGGIKKENLGEIVAAGARVAVISAILSSNDPEASARELAEAIEGIKKEQRS